MTTRIITFLVGDSYEPSFATVTGRGPHPQYFMNSVSTFCVFLRGSCVARIFSNFPQLLCMNKKTGEKSTCEVAQFFGMICFL